MVERPSTSSPRPHRENPWQHSTSVGCKPTYSAMSKGLRLEAELAAAKAAAYLHERTVERAREDVQWVSVG